MSLALFGGTFDPIHRGHLAIASAAADAFALDRVIFAPTGRQPLKSDTPTASFADRLAMTALACTSAADPRFLPSDLDAPRPDGRPSTLRLGLPTGAAPGALRDAVQRWLKRQAREVFEARCVVYGERLGVQPTRLQLSSARTRWGSASADGSIRLNWRLVHFPLPMIDYVVVHELAHLREMNHSARFWSVVREALPDFEAARDALRSGAVPMFD